MVIYVGTSLVLASCNTKGDIMNIIKGKDAILAAMVACNTQGVAWQNSVQEVAASTVLHIHEHGDYRIVATLLRDFPKGAKSSALIAYFNTFAPIIIETKGTAIDVVYDGDKRLMPDDQLLENGEIKEDYKKFLIAIEQEGWYTFKPAPKKTALNLTKKVADLLKAVETHKAEPIEGDNIPDTLVEALSMIHNSKLDIEQVLGRCSIEQLEMALVAKKAAVIEAQLQEVSINEQEAIALQDVS